MWGSNYYNVPEYTHIKCVGREQGIRQDKQGDKYPRRHK